MPLPPELDKKIRERFEELENEAKRLMDMKISDGVKYARIGNSQLIQEQQDRETQYERDKIKLTNNIINLFRILDNKTDKYNDIIQKIEKTTRIIELHGIISAFREDYEKGFLDDLTQMIEANITSDYLELAEGLLSGAKNQTGAYNHVPAAVLTGAILEESLRILCQRQNPPVDVKDKDGKSKNLGGLIDSLKKDKKTGIGLFDELKAKQLRAWADIRNAAAHGEFAKITEQDVELMITGVKNFLAEYM